MVKFKFTQAKWCVIFLVFTIANIHISLMIMRYYNKPTDENPKKVLIPSIEANHLHIPVIDLSESISAKQATPTVKRYIARNVSSTLGSRRHKPQLPAFATDSSEFFFGGIIERQFESWDLHITTMMLCHYLMEPDSKNGAEKVHPVTHSKWKRAMVSFRGISYLKNGQRNPEPGFYCRIKNSAISTAYVVKGFFVPNRLTSDSNANRRLDILRCPMEKSREAYMQFARTDEEVMVEILRDEYSIINFTIPWETRKTGYMLSSPPAASRFDSWKGFDAAQYVHDSNQQLQTIPDDVHICVPGTKRYPGKDVIPLFLEFVSHHLLLDASHIYFPVSMGWNSPHMDLFLQLFRSYIDEGTLSVISHAGDGLDMVHSVAGVTWSRLMIKVMQVNMCLYESKGVADYVVVLDIDEFFIPRPGFPTIASVLRAVDAPSPLPLHPAGTDLETLSKNWTGGPGWADGDAHPLCFMTLQSEVIANERSFAEVDTLHPWIGERFKHGPEAVTAGATRRFGYAKAVLPTRVIFQGGLSMAGACMLDRKWMDCKPSEDNKAYCGNPADVRRLGLKQDGLFMDFRMDHTFYESVLLQDSKTIDSQSQAVVYHYLLHHPDLAASASAFLNMSDYSRRFFSGVMDDLKARNLHLVMLIPDSFEHPTTSESQWSTLFTKDMIDNWAAFQAANMIPGAVTITDVLPTNFSTRAQEHFVELPNFAVDFSDYALAAMIERVSDSYDLWLSTFFLCHWLLEPKIGGSAQSGEKISPEVHDIWKTAMVQFEKTRYYENGERLQPPVYLCKITHGKGYTPYVVPGRFVPNKLTPDSNSNRRLDIFRCKMKDTELAYMNLARSDEVMEVEILRDDVSILAFRVPWKTRSTGFMISAPNYASKLDPWHGFNKETPGVWQHDNLYMCVPGMETPVSKASLPLYLEFIQHHLLLGVDHIIIGALFGWESIHMKRLLRVLKSYIDANQVSVISTSGDGFDGIYSTGGLVWARDNVKNFHVNMCTYAAKGRAHYVGVWDFDEHFIPFGNNTNIIDVIRSKEAKGPLPYVHAPDARPEDIMPGWRSGPGLADLDGHPFCYLILNSVATLHAERIQTYDLEHPWMGERFAHMNEPTHGLAFKKSIRPTRTIFQGGLHLAGTCRLPYPYSGCEKDVDFCWSDGWEKGEQYRLTKFANGSAINFNLNHRFDEIVLDQDAKVIDQDTEAVINHIQYHRFWFQASKNALESTGYYTARYFPTVYKILAEKGLELPVTLPEVGSKPFPEADYEWVSFADLRAVIDTPGLPSLKSAFFHGLDALTSSSDSASTYSASLPAFSFDKSEVFFGSMIERVSDSWDLYLTTFIVSHSLVEEDPNGYSGQKVHPDHVETWKTSIQKQRVAPYTLSGTRQRVVKFYCRLRNSASSVEYVVEAQFVPNRLTPDMNANRRMDIMRCKMNDAQASYMTLAMSTTDNVYVEIIRDSTPLISFQVPWASRVNGKTLEIPPSAGASRFDVWKGFDKTKPGVWTHDQIYMCVPGIDSSPSKKGLPIFLEFVQHHLLIGVQHIFLTAAFDWKSVHMARYLRTIHSYVQDGTVTMNSHSTEEMDFIYTFLGASWHRDAFKIFQVNMCTYLVKGIAEYVGLWDVDEYFIPKAPHTSILSVLNAVTHRGDGSTLPVFADNETHPFCYLQLQSQVIANSAPKSEIDPNYPWIGQRFGHGIENGGRAGNQFAFKKSIIPTRKMFQVGLHMSGACRLDYPWNGAANVSEEFRYVRKDPRRDFSTDPGDISPRKNHAFDEVVYDSDTRVLNMETEGVIYHFLLYRFYHAVANETVLMETNDYSARFFNKTLTALTERNLDMLITLPEDILPLPRADQKWTQYEVVYESRSTMGSLFPGGELQGINV